MGVIKFQSPSGDSLIWKILEIALNIQAAVFQSPSGDSLIWKSFRGLYFLSPSSVSVPFRGFFNLKVYEYPQLGERKKLFQSPSGDSLIWKIEAGAVTTCIPKFQSPSGDSLIWKGQFFLVREPSDLLVSVPFRGFFNLKDGGFRALEWA